MQSQHAASMFAGKGANLAITAFSWGLIAWALVIQHYDGLDPCPLCILQRYAFLLIGAASVVAAFAKPGAMTQRISQLIALLAALAGAGVAIRQLWVIAHPVVQCGRDQLEIFVNRLWPAQVLPEVFRADGLCGMELPKIFGILGIPEGALLGFVLCGLASVIVIRARAKS